MCVFCSFGHCKAEYHILIWGQGLNIWYNMTKCSWIWRFNCNIGECCYSGEYRFSMIAQLPNCYRPHHVYGNIISKWRKLFFSGRYRFHLFSNFFSIKCKSDFLRYSLFPAGCFPINQHRARGFEVFSEEYWKPMYKEAGICCETSSKYLQYGQILYI